MNLAVATEPAQAATSFVLTRTVVSPTVTGGGFFGQAAAPVGDRFLVGSRDCDTVCGAVHLFDSDGNPLRTTFAPTEETFSDFGDSVGAVGSNPLVGAPRDDTAGVDAGAAYLFDGASGILLQTFLNPNPASTIGDSDSFGSALTGFGDDVLVAAPNEDIGADAAGVVYLFDGATGQLVRTIENPTPEASDIFGAEVSAVGSNFAVAAPLDSTATLFAGAVYLFDGNGNLIRTIVSPRPRSRAIFGSALAALGNNLLVGEARGSSGDVVAAGAVHLFDGTTGDFIRTFTNPTPVNFEFFGDTVAAAGGDVLVGAPRDETAGPFAGAAYLLDGTTGELIHTFLNPHPAPPTSFGEDLFPSAVAAIGDSIFLTAQLEDNPEGDQLSVGVGYLFKRVELLEVDIDIRPGEVPNPINPRSPGRVPVAILSSADFDAPAQVDRSSLTFGRTGSEPSLSLCSPGAEDVNGDGLLDLVCQFEAAETGFQPGDTEGILRGRLLDGTPIEGRDSVFIVPPA